MNTITKIPRYYYQEKVLGTAAQQRLLHSSAVIVGIGALGTTVAQLLARAGIEKLILIDRDVVEESNLPRQTLYEEADLGHSKVLCAKKRLLHINSQVTIIPKKVHLQAKNVSEIDSYKPNLIIDGTDNLKTRFLINDYCKQKNIPWIFASVLGTKGQVMVIYPNGPCLSCFITETSLETCLQSGILNCTTSLVGSCQASLAIQLLSGNKPKTELISIETTPLLFRKIIVKSNPSCPRCKGNLRFLSRKEAVSRLKFCSSNKFLLNGPPLDLKQLYQKFNGRGDVWFDGVSLKFQNLVVFANGEVLIEAASEEEAQGICSKYLGN